MILSINQSYVRMYDSIVREVVVEKTEKSVCKTTAYLVATWLPEEGFEPSTFGLWARRATRLLYSAI